MLAGNGQGSGSLPPPLLPAPADGLGAWDDDEPGSTVLYSAVSSSDRASSPCGEELKGDANAGITGGVSSPDAPLSAESCAIGVVLALPTPTGRRMAGDSAVTSSVSGMSSGARMPVAGAPGTLPPRTGRGGRLSRVLASASGPLGGAKASGGVFAEPVGAPSSAVGCRMPHVLQKRAPDRSVAPQLIHVIEKSPLPVAVSVVYVAQQAVVLDAPLHRAGRAEGPAVAR